MGFVRMGLKYSQLEFEHPRNHANIPREGTRRFCWSPWNLLVNYLFFGSCAVDRRDVYVVHDSGDSRYAYVVHDSVVWERKVFASFK
jgi:hypothetical protein